MYNYWYLSSCKTRESYGIKSQILNFSKKFKVFIDTLLLELFFFPKKENLPPNSGLAAN